MGGRATGGARATRCSTPARSPEITSDTQGYVVDGPYVAQPSSRRSSGWAFTGFAGHSLPPLAQASAPITRARPHTLRGTSQFYGADCGVALDCTRSHAIIGALARTGPPSRPTRVFSSPQGRGGRAVEGSGLENRQGGNSFVGSNPTHAVLEPTSRSPILGTPWRPPPRRQRAISCQSGRGPWRQDLPA